MNCPACNTTVPSDAQFCPHCGKPLPTLNDATANRPAATVDQTAQQMLRRQALADEPERELWEGSYSSQAMLGAWILTIVGTIAGVVAATYMPDLWIFVIVGAPLVWLLLLTKLIYRRLSVRYRLTTQRFIHETGILRRVTHRMDVIDMDDITFEQSLWERLTGTGTIRIIATDRTDPLMHLEGIASVKEVAKQIDDARRQERRRRGLHIETI